MIFGLVGAILIMFIEMTLYIIRACQTEYGIPTAVEKNAHKVDRSLTGKNVNKSEIEKEIYLSPEGHEMSKNEIDEYILSQSNIPVSSFTSE